MTKKRAVFLDRDGTLIEHFDYLTEVNQVALMAKAAGALKYLKGHGFVLVMISNQSGVARGLLSEEKLRVINDHLHTLLIKQGAYLDGMYYCPYHPDGKVAKYRTESELRKPRPGMLLQASEDLEIDLSQSWMIGDDDRDIMAGRAAGCRTIMLKAQGSPLVRKGEVVADHKAKDLQEAANIVVHYADAHKKTMAPDEPDEPAAPSEPDEPLEPDEPMERAQANPGDEGHGIDTRDAEADEPEETGEVIVENRVETLVAVVDPVEEPKDPSPPEPLSEPSDATVDTDEGDGPAVDPKMAMGFEVKRQSNYEKRMQPPADQEMAMGFEIPLTMEESARSTGSPEDTGQQGVPQVAGPEAVVQETGEDPDEDLDAVEVVDPAVRKILNDILREIKQSNRHGGMGAEFSIFKVLAGIIQMLVLLCLVLAYRNSGGLHPDPVAVQNCLLTGVVCQVMALTFLLGDR
ncbi:MAG: HAD-IIIA family hydrolase [Phycisphaerae bacterium]|nr:HAD-IIIA family hydrolase [Phycisphaerae bacterium]